MPSSRLCEHQGRPLSLSLYLSSDSKMDSLTDELLLHTLSFVSDGLTLLDAVPQVCKRWHTYRRDLRIWASADLASSKMGDLSRLLLHAPAAHSLRIGGFGYQVGVISLLQLML